MEWLEAACFAEDYWEELSSEDCFLFDKQPHQETKYTLPPDFDNSTAPRMKKPRTKWSSEEDQLLKTLCTRRRCNWSFIQRKFPDKTLISLKRRWANKLDPSINKSRWTEEEDETILHLYKELGGNWQAIASRLHGRPSTSVKNRYYGALKRRSSKSEAHETAVDEALVDSFFADDELSFEETLKGLQLENDALQREQSKEERVAELYGRMKKIEKLLTSTQTQVRDLEAAISSRLNN
jgi:hypothetical protein